MTTATIEAPADEAMFRSAQEALTFALHYSHNQSPRTPMQQMLKRGTIGTGKGLIGNNGAHQAGAIQQALGHLRPDQQAVLMVRFGDVRSPCSCCGNPHAPSRPWRDAVDLLSHTAEIADLHPNIRHAIVEKVVCRRRGMRVSSLASQYEASERTIRSRIQKVKPVLVALESSATQWVQDFLQARGVVA